MLPSLEVLIEQFRQLPAVGKKTAVRLAFSILDFTDEQAQALISAIADAKANITLCPVCCNICEGEVCEVCADPKRDRSIICVLEDYRAVMAFDKVREYNGVYHVLHGVLSPIDGIGPEQLKIDALMRRIKAGGINEVIIATNPTIEGETTALYLTKLLSVHGVRVSRLAYGMPVGGDLEYTDESTILRAIEGRKIIH